MGAFFCIKSQSCNWLTNVHHCIIKTEKFRRNEIFSFYPDEALKQNTAGNRLWRQGISEQESLFIRHSLTESAAKQWFGYEQAANADREYPLDFVLWAEYGTLSPCAWKSFFYEKYLRERTEWIREDFMLKVAVYGKGGIGKSTVTSNLAAALPWGREWSRSVVIPRRIPPSIFLGENLCGR